MSATESTLKMGINSAAAVTGLSAMLGPMNNIYKIAIAIGTAFTGWKITAAVFASMKTAESQIIRLQTALQNATAGVKDYRDAMRFAAKTPFPVESVIDAAVALRTFKFDPFKQVEKGGRQLLEVLGDMAGAMGQDVTTATHALTRAMVGEWEIMQNNFQISSRMIPKLRGLATGTEAYGKAIVDFLTKQDRFRGGMDRTSKSLSGMLSNMKDGIDLLFMGIGGVDDSMSGAMKGLTLYDSVKDAFREVYQAVSDSNDVLDEQGNLLQKGVSQGEKIQRVGQGIGQAFRTSFEIGIKPFFTATGGAIKSLLDMSERFFARFYKGSVQATGLGKRAFKVYSEVNAIYLAGSAKELSKAWSTSSAETVQYLGKLGLTAKSTNEQVQNALRQSFLETKNDAEKGFMVFAILMGIFTEELKQKAAKMFQPFLGLFERLKPTVMNTLEAIGGFFTGMFSGILEFLPEISAGVQELIEVFKELFDSAFGTEEMKNMWAGIGNILGRIVGLVVTITIEVFKLVRWPLTLMKGIFLFISKVLKGDFLGAIKQIGATIKELILIPMQFVANSGKAIAKFIGLKPEERTSETVQKNKLFGKAIESGDPEFLSSLKSSEAEGKLDEQLKFSKEQFVAKEREDKARHKELVGSFNKNVSRPLFEFGGVASGSNGSSPSDIFNPMGGGGRGGRGPTIVQQNITIQGAVNDNALRNLERSTRVAMESRG